MLMMKIKKQEAQKSILKGKLKFEDYKHCLDATQLDNKINKLEKNKLDMDSLRENHKKFIKNNRLILKYINIKVNKITLSSN